MIDKKRLKEILSSFHNKRIVVIGDLMMDEYIWGKVSRISPEAPVPVVEVSYQSFVPGGAANVGANIQTLGGKTYITGVVGKDETGKKLLSEMKKQDIDTKGVIYDNNRPTTLKTRIIAHGQQVVRADREKIEEISKETARKITGYMSEIIEDIDGIIMSDYGKGVMMPSVIKEVIALTKKHKKIISTDPKPKNLMNFRGVSVIAPNQMEAGMATGMEIKDGETLCSAGEKILTHLKCMAVLITRGEHGMSLFESNGNITHIPAVTSEVYDVTGAGDTVIAVFTLALVSGASMLESTVLSNYAAGAVVKKVGTASVTREEVEAIIDEK